MATGGYEIRVSPGSAPLPASATPDMFGAGIGRQLEGIGEDLQRRNEQNETAAAGVAAANARLEITKGVQDLQSNLAPGAAGYSDQVAKLVDQHRDTVLAGITDSRVRKQQEEEWANFGARVQGDAYQFQTVKSTDKRYTDFDNQGDVAANRVSLDPSPKAWADEIAAIDAARPALGGPADVNEKAGREQYNKVTTSYVDGLILKNPRDAKAKLETGAFGEYLAPKTLTALRDRAQSAIDSQDAHARALVSQAKTEEREAIATFKTRLTISGSDDPATIDGYADRAEKIGDTSTALELRANAQQVRVTTGLRGQPPAELQDHLTTLEAKRTAGGAEVAPALAIEIAGTRKLLDETTQRVKQSPMLATSWATGKPPPALDLSDQGSIAARMNYATAAAKRWGGRVEPLLPAEAAAYSEKLGHSTGAQIEVLGELAQLGPSGSLAAAHQVADHASGVDSRIFVNAMGLAMMPDRAAGMASARAALLGPEAIKAHPELVGTDFRQNVSDVFNEYSPAMQLLPPGFQAAMRDTATNIYAYGMAQRGFTDWNEDAWRVGLRRAAGSYRVGGVPAGGFGDYHGAKVMLPIGMTEDEFTTRYARADLPALSAAAGGRTPVYDDGHPYTGDALKRLVPVVTPSGRYRLTDGAGHFVAAQGGGAFEFDVRALGAAPSAQGGGDPYAEFPVVPAANRSQWDRRADGSQKGMGFLGLRRRPDGGVSSELSIGVELGGREVEIPTMVPGLTKSELHWLMTTPADRQAGHVPPSITQKAVAHAKARISAGKSPFRQDGE